MENKKVFVGFCPRTDGLVFAGSDYSQPDYVELQEVEKVVKTGEGDEDFTIVKELKEVSRVSRQEYINSFAADVGILNIMKKVAMSGDVSLLNQREKTDVFCDVSNAPNDFIEMKDRIDKANEAYTKLPDDIKGKMSKVEFVQYMTNDNILKAVKDMAAKKEIKNDVKTESEVSVNVGK